MKRQFTPSAARVPGDRGRRSHAARPIGASPIGAGPIGADLIGVDGPTT